ncbi:phage minor tail protein L [Pararobbsia silviterrae]|uniref:Phage minor tail protein L n=1 Tax=Pararobbsia silviterrae TaxID=1792498 RepID=A0A494X7U8_9BURK|nr:phage minor tail protein L [Pararobbsia silviterrae]RKP43793.1 phage minor tail protein L [Pararobbsia silviterrae]
MSITNDVQKLEPGALVTLFEVDASAIGGDLLRFHGHIGNPQIVWQGNTYTQWPIEASGFERTGDTQQPNPTVTVGNVDGSISSLCIYLDDMLGAKVTRHRTLGKYLDAVNFPSGNATADPNEEMPLDVWVIQQKSSETKESVEFTLSSPLDFNGRQLPGDQIIANLCPSQFAYRGPRCNYTGTDYFDADDNPVTDPALDKCGRRLSSCKIRFGEYEVINFGGFPAASLTNS